MLNYYNKWRRFLQQPQKKTKTIKEHASRRQEVILLAEGRTDDARKRYPITAQFKVVEVLADQLRAQFGERGVSRYVMFSAKCMEEFYKTNTIEEDGKYKLKPGIRATGFFEQVMGLVMEFHRVNQRLQEKDINKYNFDTLSKTLEELPESAGERRRRLKDKSTAFRDSEIIYNENGIFAVRPLTTQASCYFGENPRLTTWCISTKSKRNYFKEYTQQEGKAFVMTKFNGIPEGDPRHFITLEFDRAGELMAFHNAPNKEFDPSGLEDIIVAHIEGLQEEHPELVRAAVNSLEILNTIKQNSKEWIAANPPPDPVEASQLRCSAAERMADQEYEFVSVGWDVVHTRDPDLDPNRQPKVTFYADLEVVWDVDKPEYETKSGDNIILTKNYRFWRNFETKFSDNLRKYGRPWSDMAGLVNCYTEDGYVKLRVRFDGYDSYHPETADGFESFVAEDCRAMENRGVQMQELLEKMLEMEAKSPENPEFNAPDPPPWEKIRENMFYKNLESQLSLKENKHFKKNTLTKSTFYDNIKEQLNIEEEKGRSRQRGIYKFYCMISYSLTTESEKSRGLDDILADMRALENVTIVTVAIRNQKISEGRYIAGLAIKFIPSTPGAHNGPETVKARIVRDIKRLANVNRLFKLSAGIIRLE
tara:strand:+ start:5357 stop:7303 length:1947 start_codon:yes stop_codon:yes gene_type:complete